MDKDIPTRASNTEKAEGDGWTSDSNTVERHDQERPESGTDLDDIVNRSGAGMRTPRRYDEGPVPEDKP
ncbi:MAG: hypothetical protein ABIX28_24905 [Vicinamibacterales bacterium]